MFDEVACQYFRKTGYVVDGLLGVNLRELTTGLRQCIDEVATKLQQSGFEYGEEATWTRTYYYDIGFYHAIFLNAAKITRQTLLCYNNQMRKWLTKYFPEMGTKRFSFMFDA
jgi:hypothetical protein